MNTEKELDIVTIKGTKAIREYYETIKPMYNMGGGIPLINDEMLGLMALLSKKEGKLLVYMTLRREPDNTYTFNFTDNATNNKQLIYRCLKKLKLLGITRKVKHTQSTYMLNPGLICCEILEQDYYNDTENCPIKKAWESAVRFIPKQENK